MKEFPTYFTGEHALSMTMRDYFAAKATEQDIENYQWKVIRNTTYAIAKQQVMTREEAKYAYADAMMKAREQ